MCVQIWELIQECVESLSNLYSYGKKTGSIENCRYTEHLSTSNILEQNKKQSQAVFKIVTKH